MPVLELPTTKTPTLEEWKARHPADAPTPLEQSPAEFRRDNEEVRMRMGVAVVERSVERPEVAQVPLPVEHIQHRQAA